MLKRHIEEEVEAHLRILPVVLLTGARQTGKTTLARAIAKRRGWAFATLDDALTLSSAQRDPAGWLLSLPKPVVIDEVQRVPDLFLAIKYDVDTQRIPGRFLLTGSANPLLLPRLGDSLAGRMGIIFMLPLSQGELRGTRERFIHRAFEEDLCAESLEELPQGALHHIFLSGGFPPAVELKDAQNRGRWIRSYLQAMMDRDVRDLAQVEGLREFPRLFRLLATRSGALLNVSDLSRSLGMVHMTLNRYLRLLETLYFVHLLPAWYSNRGKRLIKSPKLHLCDTAILAQLLDVNQERLAEDPPLCGQILESFVFSELLKQRSWSTIPFDLYHMRDGDFEVDFLLERQDGSLVGVEVKSTRTIRSEDLRGLKHLQQISSLKRGIVLYLGSRIEALGDGLWALPVQALWQ
jgi:predicted AAA+ superfamily ATPase